MKRHYREYPFEVRSAKPDGSYFEGHCAVFNNIDEYGTIMARGCFGKRLGEFVKSGFIGGLNHNWDNPIGTPKVAREDDLGLFVGGDVIDTAHGLDVRKLLAGKVCRALSFGFDDLARQWLETEGEVEAYWAGVGYVPNDQDKARCRYGALLFTEVKVYEFSPVMVPGNGRAEITAVRAEARDRLPLDEHLRAALDAVLEVSDRFEQVSALRAADGRTPAPARGALLRQMRDRIDQALAPAACRTGADMVAVRKLMADCLALEAGLLAPR